MKLKKYILGYKNRAEIVFAADQNRIWSVRLWQMRCLSDKKCLRWYVDFYKKRRRMILTSVCHFLTPFRPLNERAAVYN